MPDLQLRHLNPGELPAAFPLVRQAMNQDLQRWLSLARTLGDGGGVLAVFAGEGLPLGVAAYRRSLCGRCGSCLRIELISAFELSCREPVRRELWRGLQELAAARGCGAVIYPCGKRAAAP